MKFSTMACIDYVNSLLFLTGQPDPEDCHRPAKKVRFTFLFFCVFKCIQGMFFFRAQDKK